MSHASRVDHRVADGGRYEAKSHLGSSGWRRFGVLDRRDLDLLRYRTLAQVETLERLVEGDDLERWDHGVCASRRRAKIILLLGHQL